MSALPLSRVEIYPTRDAWLAARVASDIGPRIGASEVASVLGVEGAYRTPWEVWTEKTGQSERVLTAAEEEWLTVGQMEEPIVLFQYGRRTGRPTIAPGEAVGSPGSIVIVRHTTESWAVCSPDAFTSDRLLGDGLIEAKTDQIGGGWADVDVTIESADDYQRDIAPAKYVVQALWQLEVTGLPFVDLACRMPRHKFRVVRVMRDERHQADILNRVGEWRERHLLRGEAPEIDGSEACSRYLSTRFPGKGKDTRPATEEEAALLRELANVKAARKDCEAHEDTLGNRLHALLGDTYGVTLGSGAKGLLIPTKGRLTAKVAEIEARHPEIFARLVADGLVTRGADFRQLRLYGF